MDEVREIKEVGRTSATDKDPITSDKFTFWLAPGVIVNPFDIVEVEQVSHEGKSKTFGLVTILEHRTDAPTHLANFISSNFGELAEEPNTPRQGTTIAHVNVLSNDKDIYMPVPTDRIVKFADKEGIQVALGIDTMEPQNRIPAGLIKMSNGTSAVAYIDRRYVLGPESAHVNISGISGLATKTSYAMFLIQSILQTTPEEEKDKIAVIILNVKHGDLLQIDQRREREFTTEEMEMWEALGLTPEPFPSDKVHYFLPRGRDGIRPNSFLEPNFYEVYAYDLESSVDRLDLLFAQIPDAYFTLESIISEVKEGIKNNEPDFRDVHSWTNLLTGRPLFNPQTGAAVREWRGIRGSSIGVFRRHMRRMVKTNQSGIFVDARSAREKALSEEMLKIKGGHVYVVDIARLYEHEQMLVFGDLLKSVYHLKAEPPEDRTDPIPEKIIFFVDELNKYAPAGPRPSPLTQLVLEIAERGRSLGVILISAQQFMSAVHERVTGNCATKVIGRSSSTELNQPDYRFLDKEIRSSVTRLSKGELILSHAVYRQPVKIIFPRPAFKQPEF
ncbi:MAG TPA: ATP-binding protein [Thermococcus sp.]|nr:ATP-binding protein [Thermococcus sp.]